MDFGNIISDSLGSLTDFVSSPTTQGVLNTGAGLYNMYNAYDQMQKANQMYNLAYGSAKEQDAAAKADRERYQKLYYPIEDIQASNALKDIQALAPYFEKQREAGVENALYNLNRHKEFFRPLEEQVTSKLAEGIDSQELMNQATTDISQGFEQQRNQGLRNMMRSGINPNSGASANFMNQQAIGQALGTAGARTAARRTAEDADLARKSAALNYAKGMSLPTGAMPSASNMAAQSAQNIYNTTGTNLGLADALSNNVGGYLSMAGTNFDNLAALRSKL